MQESAPHNCIFIQPSLQVSYAPELTRPGRHSKALLDDMTAALLKHEALPCPDKVRRILLPPRHGFRMQCFKRLNCGNGFDHLAGLPNNLSSEPSEQTRDHVARAGENAGCWIDQPAQNGCSAPNPASRASPKQPFGQISTFQTGLPQSGHWRTHTTGQERPLADFSESGR